MGQIPLHYMYIDALKAGVPLRLPEKMSAELLADFRVAEDLVEAVNGWIDKADAFADIESALTFGLRQSLAWRTLRAQPDKNDYVTGQAFYRHAPEFGRQRTEAQERIEARERRKQELKTRIRALEDGRTSANLSPAAREKVVEELKNSRAELADLENGAGTPEEQHARVLSEEAGKASGTEVSIAPGNGIDSALPQDRTDLLEAAEEFRLLLGYLHPQHQKRLGVTETVHVRYTHKPLRRVESRVLMVEHHDPLRPETVLGTQLALTDSGTAALTADMLLKPEAHFVPFLRECTDYEKVLPTIRNNQAVIHLMDNYMHDSRAWFRPLNYREPTPGGFGWPRTFYDGSDRRVEYLGRARSPRAPVAAPAKRTTSPGIETYPGGAGQAPVVFDPATPPSINLDALFGNMAH